MTNHQPRREDMMDCMKGVRVTSPYNDREWTELSARMCNIGSVAGPGVEMHIDHYRCRYPSLQGRKFFVSPVLTIEEAEKLHVALGEAITEAKDERGS